MAKNDMDRDLMAEAGFRDEALYSINQKILASLVGLIAFLLPGVILPVTYFREICFRDSLSHFYYEPVLGIWFVASLSAIAMFLVAYRGRSKRESKAATIAGFAALGVAAFPTVGHGCAGQGAFLARAVLKIPAQSGQGQEIAIGEAIVRFGLFNGVQWVHYVSATVLFVFLAWYCFVVFPEVRESEQTDPQTGKLCANKVIRNRIYRASGNVIVLSILALFANLIFSWFMGMDWTWWSNNNLTFWFEAFALWAFGVSWIVRGRLFNMALKDLGESTS